MIGLYSIAPSESRIAGFPSGTQMFIRSGIFFESEMGFKKEFSWTRNAMGYKYDLSVRYSEEILIPSNSANALTTAS